MSNFVVCGRGDFKSPGTVGGQADVVGRIVSMQFANVHRKCGAWRPGGALHNH